MVILSFYCSFAEGRDLVHRLQTNFLQNLIQNRLSDNSKALSDSYNVLHSFCLSLQLEVLHAQALRLGRERLGDLIRVEEYIPGRRLSLCYWQRQDDPRTDQKGNIKLPCKLAIEVDSQDISKPLHVLHSPDLAPDDVNFTDEALKSDYLSIERLLSHTTHVRAKQNLLELKKQLNGMHIDDAVLSGSPPVLQISLLKDCLSSEKLYLTVDLFTGDVLGYVPQFEDTPLTEELNSVLKKDFQKWNQFFQKLKIILYRERIKKTCEMLPVVVYERLPFISSTNVEVLKDPSIIKLFIQFCRSASNYLLITISTSPDSTGVQKPDLRYFLLTIESSSLENVSDSPQYDFKLGKAYAKLNSMIELEIRSIIGSKRLNKVATRKSVNGLSLEVGKRKTEEDTVENKRQKLGGFFLSEVAFLINFCEERLVFGALSSELQKRRICHHIRSGDELGSAHYVDIIQYPPDSFGFPPKLRSNLTNCSIRLQGKGNYKIWMVLLTFHNTPQICHALKDSNPRKIVPLVYDFSSGSQAQIKQMVNDLQLDWTAILKLYEVVSDFVEHPNINEYLATAEIKSYSYKKILIGYGPYKNYLLSIFWKSAEKQYQLLFGLGGITTSNSNPHNIVATELQHEFNQHRSIAQVLRTLNNTLTPMLTLQRLTNVPLIGVVNNRPHAPVQSFCILPQSSTHIRLIYRESYCVDILFMPDGPITIRDGALSLFDSPKTVEDYYLMQWLNGFLGSCFGHNGTHRRKCSPEEFEQIIAAFPNF